MKIDPTKQPKVRIKETGEVKKPICLDYDGQQLIEVTAYGDKTGGRTRELNTYKREEIEFVTDEPDKVSDCRNTLRSVRDILQTPEGDDIREHAWKIMNALDLKRDDPALKDVIDKVDGNSKVSSCCGAELDIKGFTGKLECKSCGEPCEAVEEKTLSEKHRECVVDDKPKTATQAARESWSEEKNKVSDCCGAQWRFEGSGNSRHKACNDCDRPCNAVEAKPDIKIQRLPLKTRTKNALERAGIRTTGELEEKTRSELLNIHSLGEKGVDEIEEMLDITKQKPVIKKLDDSWNGEWGELVRFHKKINELVDGYKALKTDIINLKEGNND